MRIALLRSGNWPGGNSTSTTGPMTWTTRPTRLLSLMAPASFTPPRPRAQRQAIGPAPPPAGGASSVGTDVKGLSPAHDLRNLFRDRRLPRPVERERQRPDHLRGVVRRGTHRAHSGGVLASLGLQQ